MVLACISYTFDSKNNYLFKTYNIYNIQMSHFPLYKYNKRTTRFITNLIVS